MRKNDYLLLLFIMLFTFLAFLIRENVNLNNSFLIIKLGSKIVNTVPLTQKEAIFSLKTKHGLVKIEIKEKKARIISSPCKNKLCIKQGFISKPGETIVCLPEKVLLTIKNNSEKGTQTTSKEETIDAVLK